MNLPTSKHVMTQTMQFEKQTKNTFKYSARGANKPPFGEIYIQKSAFANGEAPQHITVIVEA